MFCVDNVITPMSSSSNLDPNEEFVGQVDSVIDREYIYVEIKTTQPLKVTFESAPSNNGPWKNHSSFVLQHYETQVFRTVTLKNVKFLKCRCRNVGDARTDNFMLRVGTSKFDDPRLFSLVSDGQDLHYKFGATTIDESGRLRVSVDSNKVILDNQSQVYTCFTELMDVDEAGVEVDFTSVEDLIFKGHHPTNVGVLTVSSSSNDDSATGKGMRKVRVVGLKSPDSTAFESEDVVLNGKAGASTVSRWYRVISAEGVEFGSEGVNVGDVLVARGGDKVSLIRKGVGVCRDVMFTVPKGSTAVLKNMSVEMISGVSSNNVDSGRFYVRRKPCGRPGRGTVLTVFGFEGGRSEYKLEGGTDVRVGAVFGKAKNVHLLGKFEVWLYPKVESVWDEVVVS